MSIQQIIMTHRVPSLVSTNLWSEKLFQHNSNKRFQNKRLKTVKNHLFSCTGNVVLFVFRKFEFILFSFYFSVITIYNGHVFQVLYMNHYLIFFLINEEVASSFHCLNFVTYKCLLICCGCLFYLNFFFLILDIPLGQTTNFMQKCVTE